MLAATRLVCVLVTGIALPNRAENASIDQWNPGTCRIGQFACKSGECIAQFMLCDGDANCKDASDEMLKECQDIPCPDYAFRCSYGACIEADKKCNGVKNCADNSDEKNCGETVQFTSNVTKSKCRNRFICKSGTCLDPFLLCDGRADCDDGSDESRESCANFTCPPLSFQCDYGACVSKVDVCDGKAQCADSSDEKPSLCGSTTSTSTSTTTEVDVDARPPPQPAAGGGDAGCSLPRQPANGVYKLGGCDPPACSPVPGDRVRTAFLLYTCDAGYELTGQNVLLCDKKWSAPFPTCEKVSCPPLQDPSRDIVCSHNGESVSCESKMLPETRATVRCNTNYNHGPEFSNFDTVCQANGQWSRVVTPCVPKCGEANPNGVPYIAHGRKTRLGEYPWHAGLYRKINGDYQQFCGGSIISERLIITAAHCFWDDSSLQKIDFKDVKVVVGKYYLDWNNRTKHVQIPEIDHVVLHDYFKGNQRRYENDISLITLKTEIRMTQVVRPICVDYEKEFLNHFTPGTNGIVLGWGLTERMKRSEVLHTATLPYVDFRTCEKEVPESFQSFLTYDKFCAGYRNGTSVCPGDSGGGFASQFRDGKWYLMGIVSVGVPSNNADDCNIWQYATFTRVFEHYEFIRKNKGILK